MEGSAPFNFSMKWTIPSWIAPAQTGMGVLRTPVPIGGITMDSNSRSFAFVKISEIISDILFYSMASCMFEGF